MPTEISEISTRPFNIYQNFDISIYQVLPASDAEEYRIIFLKPSLTYIPKEN